MYVNTVDPLGGCQETLIVLPTTAAWTFCGTPGTVAGAPVRKPCTMGKASLCDSALFCEAVPLGMPL
jgi:hypothetical protein